MEDVWTKGRSSGICNYMLPRDNDTPSLQVCTLTPSADTLFPEYDWLIGNHSDELTPWLPVMAARSSFKTRFFVLPCCAHDFNQKVSDNVFVYLPFHLGCCYQY